MLTTVGTERNLIDGVSELATGVAAIRFSILSNNGSGQVFREIDVNGSPPPEPASIAFLRSAALVCCFAAGTSDRDRPALSSSHLIGDIRLISMHCVRCSSG